MGVSQLISRHKKTTAVAVAILAGAAWAKYSNAQQSRKQRQESSAAKASLMMATHAKAEPGAKKPTTRVDAVFLARTLKLVRHAFPRGLVSTEGGMLALLALLLLTRTKLSLLIADVGSGNARAMVLRNKPNFYRGILRMAAVAVPAAVVNSLVRYFTSRLGTSFRHNLNLVAHDKYLKGKTYFTVSASNAMDNVDQRLTADIEKWSESLSQLFVSMFKPVVDVVIFSMKVADYGGAIGPLSMSSYFFASAIFLQAIMPPYGKLTAKSAQLEGQFRFNHTRVINHAEEISFMGGGNREKEILNASLMNIIDHNRYVFKKRAAMGVIDEFMIKYGATFVGYTIIGRPIFNDGADGRPKRFVSEADITQFYALFNQYLMSLAKSLGQLVLLYKNFTTLAGYTNRVAGMMDLLDRLNKDTSDKGEASIEGGGRVTEGDMISFEDVDVVNPDKVVLASGLGFQIPPGHNLLISGPNGCGKSSLFRILGGLWPLTKGTIVKPPAAKLFYIPQRPYLALGDLRDQVIYPDSRADMERKGISDEYLSKLLSWVHLSYLAERPGGWNAINDWEDVLSGGEKQRMAMARLFYHAPRYAILDECTSAVSMDVEGEMYEKAKELEITLVTVSHRKSLWKYHDYVLRFDGEGGWEFDTLTPADLVGET